MLLQVSGELDSPGTAPTRIYVLHRPQAARGTPTLIMNLSPWAQWAASLVGLDWASS